MLFSEYVQQWHHRRKQEGLRTAGEDPQLLDKLLPRFGGLHLEAITRREVRAWVSEQKASGAYAPRTVRRYYRGLQAIINAAVYDDCLSANNTKLGRRDLPPNVDADPMWRARARYTTEEVRLLVADVRIPFRRRAAYAVAFATGVRFGELAGLSWGSIVDREPLDALVVGRSWSTNRQTMDATKTNVAREVPLLPTISRMLERWADRWGEEIGRNAPGPGDLIFPSSSSDCARLRALRNDTSNNTLSADLKRVGIEPTRSWHAMRRTFIDLARGHGARKDVVALFTHAKASDMVEVYSEMPWPVRCEEIERMAAVFEVLR